MNDGLKSSASWDDDELTIRGRSIRQDADGFVCVNDIHQAAGFTKNQKPGDFIRLPQAMAILPMVHEKTMGKSHSFAMRNVWRAAGGRNGGTFAHPLLPLAYAEYLSPKLAVEVKEVFLRYKAADATLADDILERAPAEANEWAGKRALGRAVRAGYTATLASHGVSQPLDYARCTNATSSAPGCAQKCQIQWADMSNRWGGRGKSMSAPARKPFYYDFGNNDDGIPPAEGAPWTIDDFVSMAKYFRDWLVKARGLALQVEPISKLEAGAGRISFSGGGLDGLIELTPDPSGWVLVVGTVGDKEVFRGYLDRPYDHYELWPENAHPAKDEEGPGRVSKHQTWIALKAEAWPVLQPLADETGWVEFDVDEEKLRQAGG